MQTIWKFELEVTDQQSVEMPKNAVIINVTTQGNNPVLYAIVDTENKKEKRYFETFGTGHEIMSDLGQTRKYIGTYKIHNDKLVFHVFEYTGV